LKRKVQIKLRIRLIHIHRLFFSGLEHEKEKYQAEVSLIEHQLECDDFEEERRF
jgi:hypothetical protein